MSCTNGWSALLYTQPVKLNMYPIWYQKAHPRRDDSNEKGAVHGSSQWGPILRVQRVRIVAFVLPICQSFSCIDVCLDRELESKVSDVNHKHAKWRTVWNGTDSIELPALTYRTDGANCTNCDFAIVLQNDTDMLNMLQSF